MELTTHDLDYSLFLLIGSIDTIRKSDGHYIWGFPIKYYENGVCVKTTFGWEIEYSDGKCVSYGYSGEPEINSYQDALQAAVNFLKK